MANWLGIRQPCHSGRLAVMVAGAIRRHGITVVAPTRCRWTVQVEEVGLIPWLMFRLTSATSHLDRAARLITEDGEPHLFPRSARGLWQSARVPNERRRRPYPEVEELPLLYELLRREEACKRYYGDPRRYGFTSAVTIRNDRAMADIREILVNRDEWNYESLDNAVRDLSGLDPRTEFPTAAEYRLELL